MRSVRNSFQKISGPVKGCQWALLLIYISHAPTLVFGEIPHIMKLVSNALALTYQLQQIFEVGPFRTEKGETHRLPLCFS